MLGFARWPDPPSLRLALSARRVEPFLKFLEEIMLLEAVYRFKKCMVVLRTRERPRVVGCTLATRTLLRAAHREFPWEYTQVYHEVYCEIPHTTAVINACPNPPCRSV